MQAYSILRPDHLEWSTISTYDKNIARYLTRAYRRIHLGGKTRQAYLDSYNIVRPYLSFARCPFQRQRILYLRALKHSATGNYVAALHWLDLVIEMAGKLPTGDLAYVFYQHGGLNRALLRFREAATDHQLALAFLYEPENIGFAQDASFELSILGELAGFEFFLCQFDTAESLLHQARTLIPLVPAYSLEVANIEWIQAHLYRLTRRPQLAVEASAEAARIYTERGAPISASRILSVAADARLDLAASLPPGTARRRAIRVAGEDVRAAEALAVQSRAATNIALARLTAIRYERMSGIRTDRIGAIEDIWALARRIDDDAMLAQSITALADELAATGHDEASLGYYRDVLGLLDGGAMPVLGYPALRAVLQADEQRI